MPWLVVLDGQGYISCCKGIKREFKIIFSCKLFSGNNFDIQSFLENYPLLSLACEHRCISAAERIQQQRGICLRSLATPLPRMQ